MALPLSAATASGVSKIIVTPCNAPAIALLDNWQNWPFLAAVLVGPPCSGKSLLGGIFAQQTGGSFIDDADTAKPDHLFHMWNVAQAEKRPILLASRLLPEQWALDLADWRSRLAASQLILMPEPDDMMRKSLLYKALERAHLPVGDHIIDYALARLDRSYAAVDAFARLLDRRSLEKMQPASHNLVREVLQSMQSESDS